MPAKQKATEAKESDGKETRRPLMDAFHKLLLASIGAAAIAQDEAEELVNKLVERGEIARKDGEKLVKEMMEKRKQGRSKAEGEFNKRIEAILGKMNVPNKADIDALGEKIAKLSEKVDELKKSQG